MTHSVEIPRIAALNGEQLRHALLSQLQQRDLESCLILAYRFNDFDLVAGPSARGRSTGLFRLLERSVSDGVALTMVTRDPLSERETPLPVLRAWWRTLGQLRHAGADIRVHPALHAKVYLFRSRGERTLYAVGSSNMTHQGLGYRWAECNVRGYHPLEYALVQRQAQMIASHPKTEALASWEVRLRKTDPRLAKSVFT